MAKRRCQQSKEISKCTQSNCIGISTINDDFMKNVRSLVSNNYPVINAQMNTKILYWIESRKNKTFIEKYGIPIRGYDIDTLKWDSSIDEDLKLLNDQIINIYFKLIMKRSQSNQNLPKVHAYDCFLFDYNQNVVREHFIGNINLYEFDLILIPVFKEYPKKHPKDESKGHWLLFIIYTKEKTIKCYDSINGRHENALNAFKQYLNTIENVEWNLKNETNIPQQENGFDCGVFVCQYAEFISRNQPITFSQKDMIYFRQKMIYEICTGKLLN